MRFGPGQALAQGDITGLERQETLEVKGFGEPLGLRLAVLGLELMPVGDFLG
jgi:hypothetical protein